MIVENKDGLSFLENISDNEVSLVITDPPYIISKTSGMQKQFNDINSKTSSKSLEQWNIFSKDKVYTEEQKKNYMKYGSIMGKKYAYRSEFGDWDKNFTMEELDKCIKEYYRVLKTGGTLILWFDIYKFETLKVLFEKHKFKQLRIIQWVKTNPVPLNSKTNYLSNAIEYALLGVKVGKPTFKDEYHNGVYTFPNYTGNMRFHPTMKSINLFEKLINTHSNEGELVVDTFLGNGTTAIAAKNTKREFKGCEVNKEYYDKIKKMIFDS